MRRLIWMVMGAVEGVVEGGNAIVMRAVMRGNGVEKWDNVGGSDQIIAYVNFNPASFRTNGNKVKMWSMFDYTAAQTTAGYNYLSSKSYNEYDCKGKQWRQLALSLHSKNMGAGDVVYTDYKSSQWRTIPP